MPRRTYASAASCFRRVEAGAKADGHIVKRVRRIFNRGKPSDRTKALRIDGRMQSVQIVQNITSFRNSRRAYSQVGIQRSTLQRVSHCIVHIAVPGYRRRTFRFPASFLFRRFFAGHPRRKRIRVKIPLHADSRSSVDFSRYQVTWT